jgi:hypothetical protein
MKASLCNSVSDNYVENSDPENFLFNDKQKQGETQTSSSENFNNNPIEIIDRKIQTGAMQKYRGRCKNGRVWLRKEAEKMPKIRACRQKFVNKKGLYM